MRDLADAAKISSIYHRRALRLGERPPEHRQLCAELASHYTYHRRAHHRARHGLKCLLSRGKSNALRRHLH